MMIVTISNYNNEQHYTIQDQSTGMTYSVYVKHGFIAGAVANRLTPHVETVYNTGRKVHYEAGSYMYNMLYDAIDKGIS